VDDLTRRQVPLLNLLFHSSEARPGASPYNRTDADLSAFFDRLSAVLTHAVTRHGARPMTFTEFRQDFLSAARELRRRVPA
jgi:hypothetical protein